MLFNSYAFLLVYLPIVLFGFFSLAKLHLTYAARGWLFLSSLFFYGFWDVRYLPLLISSIIFNYGMGSWILKEQDPKRKKIFLIGGITGDLALLFYYKYANFFISNLLGVSQWMEIILPLGISFFTFTQIAYLVDAYQDKVEKGDFISYGLFVTIFPHLIAGPILHHKEMIKQFSSLRMYVISWSNIAQGIVLFMIGLGKKVFIADQLMIFVKPVFDESLAPVNFIAAWLGAISYTLQLYFDFSGYSDMAVGLGLLFSLHLPINFNSPYQADSMIDFWRRWHITLSQFLRDYLYISLGGNRYGKWAKMRNLFITMLLGGLWHGAGWTFVLWGACHGFFLILNHLWRDLKYSMPHLLAKTLTLLAIVVTWVIFRSPTIDQAANILAGMSGLHGIVLPEKYASLFPFLTSFGVIFESLPEPHFSRWQNIAMIVPLTLAVLFLPNSNHWLQKFQQRPMAWVAVPCALFLFTCILYLDEMTEFLYYQF
jgi:alginate O-acetyltransferase complex protein AlgI